MALFQPAAQNPDARGLGHFSATGKRERDFKIRLQQAAREQRDSEVDKLEKQFATAIERLEAKLRKEERELSDKEAEHAARKQQELVGIGETVLGFLVGRRTIRGLSTAASQRRITAGVGRAVEESKAEIAEMEQEIDQVEQTIKAQSDAITLKWANLLDELTLEAVAPRRTDINVQMVALVWLPAWLITYNDGLRTHTATIAAYQLPAVG